MKKTCSLLALLGALACRAETNAPAIRHRFLAVDESRSQLLMVDPFEPSRNWVVKLPERYRDIQLVGLDAAALNDDTSSEPGAAR